MFAVPPNTVATSVTPPSVHPALIARQLAGDAGRWQHLLRFDPGERYTGCLDASDEQEIWLMSWLPGQGTETHTHGIATGAFTVVRGLLTERVTRGTTATVHQVRAGQSRVFGPGYVHQVRNAGLEPAVSIHVYRPARELVACR